MKNFKKLFFNYRFLILLVGLVLVFFYPVVLKSKIPIAADSIVGLYHPFRDEIWSNLTAGVPVKNPLITDPVRQQVVWRNLSIDNLKHLTLPLWNPYSFSGTPLLANFQSAPFYPLNILFFILPFNAAWTVLIIISPLLAGIFLYLYLRFMKVSHWGSFIGAFSFSFSGFAISWLTWNTIFHVILWLPLILLAKENLLKKINLKWMLILIFAETSQILAGHLQFLFYSLIVSNLYLFIRIMQISFSTKENNKLFISIKKYIPFLLLGVFVFAITSIQWLPTLQFISLSARSFDQGSWTKPGWFLPWENLIQFIAPDFFGNPATGNYWGVWNYGEFIGYIGIISLFLSLYAILFRRDKKVAFFGILVLIGLAFSLPTPIAKLPFILNIPLISTSQPTRLMFIVDFGVSILAALGFDLFLKEKNIYKILILILALGVAIGGLWLFVFIPSIFKVSLEPENLFIAKHNLYLPTLIFFISAFLFLLSILIRKDKNQSFFTYLIIALVIIDLFRFGQKFTPFSKKLWLFPKTRILEKLQKEEGVYRFLVTDRRIMPPNFSAYYHLQDVSGYDPLYVRSYGELVAAWGRGKPDISPAAFNRILTPQDYTSPIADLLGVKYILSLDDQKSPKLKEIDREGQTHLYENLDVIPRTFLVGKIITAQNDQDEINKLFSIQKNFRYIVVSQGKIAIDEKPLSVDETADLVTYNDNRIIIKTVTQSKRLLVLTDIYYPTWKVSIDGVKTEIFKVDYTLRGVIVPSGIHKVEFINNLL